MARTRVGRRRKLWRWSLLAIVLALAAVYVAMFVPIGWQAMEREGLTTLMGSEFNYSVPLDRLSPWPKFRANAMQDGRAPVTPRASTLKPWLVDTGKGIFSSPVVGADGTCYIGSGDHRFYAIGLDGQIQWTLEADGIIDSSALLGDDGRLYFGAGDGKVYCVDRQTGRAIWTYQGQTPADVEREYGVETHNLGWFEGNIGMLPDGSLLAPNDNHLVYRLARETGQKLDAYLANEMVWTSPAVNVETGNLFFGSCAQVLQNVFGYAIDGAKRLWLRGGMGSVSASPMLLNNRDNGALIVGCFDGYVRAMSQKDGKTIWQTALGNHIYASAASLSDGTVIQPAADGSVYALDPASGRVIWTFDALEPIRSSPAVDAQDNIYFGSGEGKLFCLSRDGALTWSYQLITGERNDLNASPALGYDGVYIAGESGSVFFVPYGYPLSAAGRADPLVFTGGEQLPGDGAHLYALSPFGALTPEHEGPIDANQPIAYQLFVRKDGDTLPSQLGAASIQVATAPHVDVAVAPSADGRFVTITPLDRWPEPGFALEIRARAKTGMLRFGLKAFAGRDAGEVSKVEQFAVRGAGVNYPITTGGPVEASVLELKRLSVPNPVMLPSYNQIGFDSLHYLAGAVSAYRDKTVMWVVGGKLMPDGSTAYDPSIQARFPMLLDAKDGLLTLENTDGFKINFIGSWDMPFKSYRIAARAADLFASEGAKAALTASMSCDEIDYYGLGLKLMGMSDLRTGVMSAFGGMNISRYGGAAPIDCGAISFTAIENGVRADFGGTALRPEDHVYSILLADKDGKPLPLYYTRDTAVQAAHDGRIQSVSITWEKAQAPKGDVTAYLIVDSYTAARDTIPLL